MVTRLSSVQHFALLLWHEGGQKLRCSYVSSPEDFFDTTWTPITTPVVIGAQSPSEGHRDRG